MRGGDGRGDVVRIGEDEYTARKRKCNARIKQYKGSDVRGMKPELESSNERRDTERRKCHRPPP